MHQCMRDITSGVRSPSSHPSLERYLQERYSALAEAQCIALPILHSKDDVSILLVPWNVLTVLIFYRYWLLALREAKQVVPIILCAQDDRCGMSIVPLHIYFETTSRP